MGKRTEPKKLTVKKETLRKLDPQQLTHAVGAAYAKPPTVTNTCEQA